MKDKGPPASSTDTAIEQNKGVTRGPFLIAMHKTGARAFRLRSDRPTTVGRSDECDARLAVALMSRVHFSITAHEGRLEIRDRQSANGTKLNGRLLAGNEPAPVDAGSLIEAGGVFFVVRDEVPVESELESMASVTPVEESAPIEGVVVADPVMRRLYELVDMVARANLPVLVMGETGCGKEIVSHAVHARSARADKPFVSLNCAALTETLLESELFGYERGAFTGATQSKQGLIESAHGGTLFLDEVGELPLATQAKLLRVLENGEFLRVGALKPRVVDVRFVAATNRSLASLVESKQFRRDLYFRLNGITIPVPPLRERPSEIVPLAKRLLQVAAKRVDRRAPSISERAVARLTSHSWPGNVRELRNVIERALALCPRDTIDSEHILLDRPLRDDVGAVEHRAPEPLAPLHRHGSVRSSRPDPETEKRMIEDALRQAAGNQIKAAEILGVSRRTLVNRLEEYKMARPRKRVDVGDVE